MRLLLVVSFLFAFQLPYSVSFAQSMTSAYEFADSLEKEIENREVTLINERFDAEELLSRIIFKGSENKEVIDFNNGFSDSFKKGFNYGNILLGNL